MPGAVREPFFSGLFYSHIASELRLDINSYIQLTNQLNPPLPSSRVKAVIMPHAGHRFSGVTAAHSVIACESYFDTLLVLGPSHRIAFEGLSVNSVSAYRTPLGDVPVDQLAVNELQSEPIIQYREDVHAQEHSIEVILPFFQTHFDHEFQLVPIIVGQLNPDDIPAIIHRIKASCDMSRTLVVASSDFSHFFSAADAQLMDQRAIELIQAREWSRLVNEASTRQVEMCGLAPILITGALMDNMQATQIDCLHYSHSGQTSGDDSSVVGYASMIYS